MASEQQALPSPEIGDIVHYFSDYYGCVPGIVLEIEPNRDDQFLQLAIFRPAAEPAAWEAATYSATPRHGTWHPKGHGPAYLPGWKQEQGKAAGDGN